MNPPQDKWIEARIIAFITSYTRKNNWHPDCTPLDVEKFLHATLSEAIEYGRTTRNTDIQGI